MVIQLLPNGLKIGVERLCVPTLQRGKPPKLCKVVDIFHHGGPGTEHENAVREADGLGNIMGDQKRGLSLPADDAADV